MTNCFHLKTFGLLFVRSLVLFCFPPNPFLCNSIGQRKMIETFHPDWGKTFETLIYFTKELTAWFYAPLPLIFHFTLMENIKSRRWCDSEPFICFHPTCWLEQQSNCYRLTAVALIIGLLEVTRLNYCTLEFRIQGIPQGRHRGVRLARPWSYLDFAK